MPGDVISFGPPVPRRMRGMTDSLRNVMTGLGTAKDARVQTRYTFCPIDRWTLDAMYRSTWIARAIVDAPAQDMTREWRAWVGDPDKTAAIGKLETALDLQRKTRQALTRARLYGGAALVLGVARGQPQDELVLDDVGKGDLKFVAVLNCYELTPGQRILDVSSRWFGRPEFYTLGVSVNNLVAQPGMEPGQGGSAVYPDVSLMRIHPSRVIEFVGNELPDWRSPTGSGWGGDSILQAADETLKDFGISIGGLCAMLSDMKLDIIKVPDLSATLADADGEAQMINRLTVANQAKSMINSLLLDKDEDWQRIQTSFAGAGDIINVLLKLAAAAGGIPESRLLGSAPNKGLSSAGGSGGEVDMRNYYDSISATQRTDMTPTMEPLDRCLVQSALGAPDDAVRYDWNPLYQPDPAEAADIRLKDAQADAINAALPNMNPDLVRELILNRWDEKGTYGGVEDARDEFGDEPEEPEDASWQPTKPQNGGGEGGAANPPAEGETGAGEAGKGGSNVFHIHVGSAKDAAAVIAEQTEPTE